MSCRICFGPSVFYVRKDGYDIYRCTRCGFGQTDVTLEAIAAYYDKAYFDGDKTPNAFGQAENNPVPASHRYWIEEQLAQVEGKGPLSVLEIGPGLGGPLAGYFERERPDVRYAAVEISEYASERLRSRGFTVYAGRVVDAEILEACRGQYDLVFGTEVIEHEIDPHGFVAALRQMLKPGGWAAFTTGNLDGLMARWKKADWYYLDPPAHVSYYTPRAVKRVFRGGRVSAR